MKRLVVCLSGTCRAMRRRLCGALSNPDGVAADWLAIDPKTLRRVYRKFDPAYLRSIADAFTL